MYGGEKKEQTREREKKESGRRRDRSHKTQAPSARLGQAGGWYPGPLNRRSRHSNDAIVLLAYHSKWSIPPPQQQQHTHKK